MGENLPSKFNMGYYSDLAFLVTDAAVDIDNYLIGNGERYESLEKLSSMVNELAQNNREEIKDPSEINLFFQLFREQPEIEKSFHEHPTVDNLAYRIALFSQELKNVPNSRKENLKPLASFCCKLSQGIIAHHQDFNIRYLVA